MTTSSVPRPGRRIWVWSLAALVLLGAVAWLVFGRGAQDQTRVLKVGDQRGGSQALLSAAGELNDVPYRIEWSLFPAAAPLLEALGAGAIDVGPVGGAPFALAYAGGSQIKAIHAFRQNGQGKNHSPAIVAPAGSPLRSVADLKGKKIATVRGSTGQDLVLHLLEDAGLKSSDVQWVYLSNGEAKAALDSGSIDAWATWGSYVGIALLQDHDRIVADGSVFPGNVAFEAATDKAIADKRPLLADFAARLARARRWANLHPRDYAKALAKETGIPINVAEFTVNSYLGQAIPIDDSVVAEQGRIFDRYRRAGMIDKAPSLAGGYDSSFNSALDKAR
ncbi:ABC transporter substrate-binding protein [soil metagenome]